MKLSSPIHRLKQEARRLARETGVPLHRALDRIAVREGFSSWSLLAAKASPSLPAAELFARLEPGDLLLIGARPGQGKTLMGLRLAVEAMRAGRRSTVFTLEYTPQDIADRFRAIGVDASAFGALLELDTSDDISAETIVTRLASAPSGSFAVVDYLQLLDRRREHPPLAEQVSALNAFARRRGLILAFLSQVDRTYDPAAKPFPGLDDVRLSNPLDLGLFAKACFLNGGNVRFHRVERAAA
ncbi:MAG: DNA helicase [Mesorhizobium sp.]